MKIPFHRLLNWFKKPFFRDQYALYSVKPQETPFLNSFQGLTMDTYSILLLFPITFC